MVFFGYDKAKKKFKLIYFKREEGYSKTKSKYVDIYREDTFPIEEKYANVLSALFICASLSYVIPLMNVILFATIFVV